MRIIIYLIYLSIVIGSLFTMRMTKVGVASWQSIAMMLSIAGAFLCGYTYAIY